jgi:eukaryotic-like serine/threonine-protein kinase
MITLSWRVPWQRARAYTLVTLPLTPGTRLGAYEIIAAIGSGGMGDVYRARDTTLDRDVAIKVLPEAVAGDADRLARFTREAKTLAALNHPNIAQIYGIEESTGATALVMELVEGEDLSTIIASGQRHSEAASVSERLSDSASAAPRGGGPAPAKATAARRSFSEGAASRHLEIDHALTIARQIADALEAAHEQGIVHRDLKPANVKVRADGTVKVLDFGLAKAMDPAGASSASASALANSPTLTSPAMTAMGMILGTAAYMAPEQARGRPVDKRADIWAFGVVLYEMLTGRRLFEGEDVSLTLAAVLRADVNFDALPAATPDRVRRVLAACLQRDLKQRVPDIGAVRLALDGAFETSAPATALVAPAARPLWRRALPVSVALLVGGLAVGLIAWSLWPMPIRPPVTRFSIALPEGQAFSGTARRVLDLSQDGENLVYVANRRLYLRPMSGLDPRPISGIQGVANLTSPAISPDGQSVAFFTTDYGLQHVALAGGAVTTICPATNPFGLTWDESGILFGQQKGIMRVSANGGTPEVLAAAGAGETLRGPQMLPGGRAVLFTVSNGNVDEQQIAVQPLDGGARKTLIDGGTSGQYLPTGHLVYGVQGVLMAVPFDLSSLSVTGGPVVLVEGVSRSQGATSGSAVQFSVSATGALAFVPGPAVIASSSGTRVLAMVDRQGQTEPLGLPPGTYRSPRVSPDGKFVTFDTDDGNGRDVWVYALAGGAAIRKLTFGGQNQAPIWSPDGQWIVFQSDRDGDQALFRQRMDGATVAERLTKPASGVEQVPQTFSPDGRYLLYSEHQGNRWTLWAMTMADKTATAFGDVSSVGLVEAAFSPDGRWVAYQSGVAGVGTGGIANTQTFLQPFPSTGAKYLVGQGGHPYWSPKGDGLILNVAPGRSAIVPVRTTPAVTFGEPIDFPRQGRAEGSPAASRRNADSLPDGEHIIGVYTAAEVSGTVAPSSIVVVLNWFDDVRQRMR